MCIKLSKEKNTQTKTQKDETSKIENLHKCCEEDDLQHENDS